MHKILKIKIERITNIIKAKINNIYNTNIVHKKAGKAGANKHPPNITIKVSGQQQTEVIQIPRRIAKNNIGIKEPVALQITK